MNRFKEILFLYQKTGGKNDIHDSLCICLETGKLFIRLEKSSNSSWRGEDVQTIFLPDAKNTYKEYFTKSIDFLSSVKGS